MPLIKDKESYTNFADITYFLVQNTPSHLKPIYLIFMIGLTLILSACSGEEPVPVEQSTVAATAVIESPTEVTATVEVVSEEPTLVPIEASAKVQAASINMALINAGSYPLGNDETIELAAYWLDQYEITNAQYALFLAESGAAPPTNWSAELASNSSTANHPVEGVSWENASSYCSWVFKRLPTEAEWEVAARGPHGWRFPWGNEPTAVNMPLNKTYAIGAYPANLSYFGINDMSGNVWEWVDQPLQTLNVGERVLRGGNYSQRPTMIEGLVVPEGMDNVIQFAGFRCAADEIVKVGHPDLVQYTFEDFAAEAERGWRQGSETESNYFIGYHLTDFYHVDIAGINDCLTVFNDVPYPQFSIEALSYVKRAADVGDFRYGIAVGGNAERFYAFLISPRSQTWYITRNDPDGLKLLSQGPAPTLAGFDEAAPDRLTVIVNDNELTFFINGELVGLVKSADFTPSQLGFLVQTVDALSAHIHYDKLSIRQLPAESHLSTTEDQGPTPVSDANFSPICSGTYPVDSDLVNWTTHLVQEGETLGEIALIYGVSAEAILGANNIEDPSLILVGETFVIPQD